MSTIYQSTMFGVQQSLGGLKLFLEKVLVDANVETRKKFFLERIDSILKQMGGIQVRSELQGSYNDIYNQLEHLQLATVSDRLPSLIGRVQLKIEVFFGFPSGIEPQNDEERSYIEGLRASKRLLESKLEVFYDERRIESANLYQPHQSIMWPQPKVSILCNGRAYWY